MDFEVQRCTRRCFAADRELRPGEEFYSVLMLDGSEVVRRDYGVSQWSGAPDDALGWWRSRMPEATTNKVNWAPNEVMLHYFRQLENDSTRQDLRYVLALLMIRRKILRIEGSQQDDSGTEQLVLSSTREDGQFMLAVHDPSPERIEEIQAELGQMLFADSQ